VNPGRFRLAIHARKRRRSALRSGSRPSQPTIRHTKPHYTCLATPTGVANSGEKSWRDRARNPLRSPSGPKQGREPLVIHHLAPLAESLWVCRRATWHPTQPFRLVGRCAFRPITCMSTAAQSREHRSVSAGNVRARSYLKATDTRGDSQACRCPIQLEGAASASFRSRDREPLQYQRGGTPVSENCARSAEITTAIQSFNVSPAPKIKGNITSGEERSAQLPRR
jgi:hypothetical protein